METPKFEELMLPIIKMMADNEVRELSDIRERLLKYMNLDSSILNERNNNGNIKFYDNIGFALSYLSMSGLLDRPMKANYVISKEGLRVENLGLSRICSAYLMDNYPAFKERMSKKNKKANNKSFVESDSSRSPDELINENVEKIKEIAKDNILNNLLNSSPSFFEKVCKDLLLAMGYGYSSDSGKVTRYSKDGGIDGIIYGDKLGLERIFYQAKLYKGNIGRPMVAEFVGVIDGFRGVFITTSDFTKEATEYAEKHPNLFLINGEKLVDLMYEHGVGVKVKQTIIMKEVSNDYFDEL